MIVINKVGKLLKRKHQDLFLLFLFFFFFFGERDDNPPQNSCLEDPHGQKHPAGYSPWSREETRLSGFKFSFYIFFQFKRKVGNTGDTGSIPGLGRSGEGNGSPLQYSCLGNSMDGGAWRATIPGVPKSQALLSNFTFFHFQLFSSEIEIILPFFHFQKEIILPSETPWKPQIAKGNYD